MALTGFRDYFANISPSWLQGPFGAKYVAAVIGLLGDTGQALATLGLKAGWLKLDTSPADAVAPVGEGANMPKYFTDTDVTYKTRVVDRWDVWEAAGSKPQLLALVQGMGFPNAEIFEAIQDWPSRPPTPYWSQFWIVIPSVDHSFTPGNLWDDGFLYGAFTWSIQGTNATEIIGAIRDAVCHFKPGHTILREIIFETGGWSYDTGHLWDEFGLLWGGQPNINISGC